MSDTLKIGSTAPLSILLVEADASVTPGAEPRTVVIKGAGNRAEGVTEGVDADLYRAWVEAHPDHPAVEFGLFREVGADEEGDEAAGFGFEPASKSSGDGAPTAAPSTVPPAAPSAKTSGAGSVKS